MEKTRKPINLYTILALIVICIAIVFLWNTVFVLPIKIFVVLLHELSHGLAAVLTGGSIVRIAINANQGGVCTTQGGLPFIIYSAGYLGSMAWGGAILIAAARTKYDKYISIGIGIIVLAITALFIRNSYGLIFGIGFGLAMVLIGALTSMEMNDFILKVIGLTSVLYAIIDIKDDLITRDIPISDASRLGELYFGSSTFWGIVWIVIALVMSYFFLKMAARE